MPPSFTVMRKRTDIDKDSQLKSLYVSQNHVGVQEYEMYNYTAPHPTCSFYDEEFEIDLYPYDMDEYLAAYPDHITIEDLHILFLNCSYISFISLIDPSELAIFHNLRKLKLITCQKNLNGIEFLSSLEDLSIISYPVSLPPYPFEDLTPSPLENLTQLNLLNLKKLVLSLQGIEDLGSLNFETLEILRLDCKYLKTLKGIKLPNLKNIFISVSQYQLLSSFNLPTGCTISLTYCAGNHLSADICEIVKGIFPDSKVEIHDY
jgi:hypothetical protein